MPYNNKFIVGTNLRVAAPGDMVECLVDTYSNIQYGAVLRVSQTSPSPRTDSNWSYRFCGMQGIFKGCNFRLMEDKFNSNHGGKSQMDRAKEKADRWGGDGEGESNVVPEIRIYMTINNRIVHRILRNSCETAEECLARADAYIRKNPTAEAHVYRKVALRRTSPAPIENIEL